MIHLVLLEPIAYQRTLCRALNHHYRGQFVAWFFSGSEGDFTARDDFERRFLNEEGFAKLFRALRDDADPVVILGGWSASLAHKTLLITASLRVPTLIWADHPHPRKRSRSFEALRSFYLRLLSRRIKAFLACGTPTADYLAALGISRQRIFNFPYWVEVPREWSLPVSVREGNSAIRPLRLLSIGRLVPMKGFDIAIHAVARANHEAGTMIAELTIIGDGPERSNVERIGASVAPESQINFAGSLDNAEVCARLRHADALVVPSLFEPYGVVVLEALAHGRPVLASNRVIAAIDRADGSGAIQLHSSGDIEALAKQITTLANNREALRKASQAARAIAELWRPERAAQIIDTVIETTSSKHARPAKSETVAFHRKNETPSAITKWN